MNMDGPVIALHARCFIILQQLMTEAEIKVALCIGERMVKG